MKWFNPTPKTAEALKRAYKKLAFENHPDKGGSTADMQEINAEYETLFARLKNIHETADGQQTTRTTAEQAQDYIRVVEALLKIDGIYVELVGSWLWISGDTYTAKDEIKAAGCRWCKGKKMWYWKPAEDDDGKKHRGSGKSHDEVKDKYGAETVADTRGRDSKKRIA